MKTTIDRAGRNGMIEIEVAATPISLQDTRDGPVVTVDKDMPILTDEIVRETIERIRNLGC